MSNDFEALTYEEVIHQVEMALDCRCGNLCRPLNSYINRVYEVHPEDREPVIAKFYRPRRWSYNALYDELDFLAELHADEIPVIPPLADSGGELLQEFDGIPYALFPKKGGRIVDEPSLDQWRELGRLIARVHVVGSTRNPLDRITWTPDIATHDQVERILTSDCVTPESRTPFETIAHTLIDRIAPLFEDLDLIRIHGDLHAQNLIYRPAESFYLIDFDDMALGPAAQDLWMLLPGRVDDSRRELDAFLDGYETFREFPWEELKLIEPLRAMRYIHFIAWCTHQRADGGATRLSPDWGTSAYWQREIHDIEKQIVEIEDNV